MGHDVHTVVEIFAKTPGAHHFFERLVGCADQAEIDLAVCAPAQPLHLAVFKNAQQFGLQAHGQRGDLVEKERASVSQFDLAGPRFGTAPVNAPRSLPNSSDSIRLSGSAAQLRRMKGFSERC
jgi:hypothetical protein